MPYNSETETFYQAPATVVDSTPDGDTVQEGFDDRLTPAMAGLYADLNLLKADGMISVGIPATTTSRGIGRVATAADAAPGSTITNGPAFLDAATWKVSATPAAGIIPLTDADGSVNNLCGARYATCATAAATAAKDAALTGFSLVKGSRVFVTFTNANTVADAITLNVNGTGGIAIYNQYGAVSSTNPAMFQANQPIEFVYDGAHWVYHNFVAEAAHSSMPSTRIINVSGSVWLLAPADGWAFADSSATPGALAAVEVSANASGSPVLYGSGGVYDYPLAILPVKKGMYYRIRMVSYAKFIYAEGAH